MQQLVDGVPEETARLSKAVSERDLAAVRYAMHRLRSQAATFDAAPLMSAIDQLMEAAAAGRWSATEALATTVERELHRLAAELSSPVTTRIV
jgi:hypothetical protein